MKSLVTWSSTLVVTIGLLNADDSPLAGGETTVFQTSQNAFALPLANISRTHKREHVVGNSFFNSNWVIAPASAKARDGLGPLFHARSCSGCHSRDGRGRPDDGRSLLFRISIPGVGKNGGPVPDSKYGDQIAPKANPGEEPEGEVTIEYEEIAGKFDDGTPFSLRKPSYTFLPNLTTYGEPSPDLLMSPRIAPPVFGLGLLEAVDEKTILDLADPNDEDGDGISGKTNRVWNPELKTKQLGRFGWKANQVNLLQQTAIAAFGDIGLTSSIHSDESGDEPELEDRILGRLVTYQQTLAPPARRDIDDPQVIRGRALFAKANCVSCHVPTLKTGEHSEIEELSHQIIQPFTDLLLHDMGEGLADDRPDFEASGVEWRTPPLWGIGLTDTVNGHTFFLHDGRARNLVEAILWHGGEGEESAAAFRGMDTGERAALLAFLNSL